MGIMILAHPYQYRVHMFVYTVQNDYLVVRLSTLHDSISRGWGSWLRVVRFFFNEYVSGIFNRTARDNPG